MRRLRTRNDFERDRQQRVAREDCDAVPENFVARRATSAEIVVVHAREIVVDERIGVDAFHRAGERQRVVDLAATRFGRSEAKNRPQTFSAREQTVSHRLVNRRRSHVLLRQISIERAINRLLPGLEISFQIHFDRDELKSRGMAALDIFGGFDGGGGFGAHGEERADEQNGCADYLGGGQAFVENPGRESEGAERAE